MVSFQTKIRLLKKFFCKKLTYCKNYIYSLLLVVQTERVVAKPNYFDEFLKTNNYRKIKFIKLMSYKKIVNVFT